MYEGYDKLRRDLENNVKERGRRDRHNDAPFAADEQLWGIGAQFMSAEFGAWAEVNAASSSVAEQLIELRDWYDEGRRPQMLDLGAIAGALNMLGVEASAAHDSGGTWLLNVGRSYVDEEGVYRAAVTGGPGHDAGRNRIEAYAEQFSFGTGDPAVPNAEQVVERIEERPYTAAEVAELIYAVYGQELARRGQSLKAWLNHEKCLPPRIKAAAEAAELAFWQVVAASFPEITTGDADPGMAFHTSQVMEQAITSWIDGNGDQNTPWAAEEELPEGTCGRCGALDKTACDCVTVEPSPDLQAYADDLVRRAEQLRAAQDGQQ